MQFFGCKNSVGYVPCLGTKYVVVRIPPTRLWYLFVWPFSLQDGCSAFLGYEVSLHLSGSMQHNYSSTTTFAALFLFWVERTQSRLQGHIKTTTGSEQVLNVNWLSITRSGIHHFSIASSTKNFYSFSARFKLSFQERFHVSGDAVISIRTLNATEMNSISEPHEFSLFVRSCLNESPWETRLCKVFCWPWVDERWHQQTECRNRLWELVKNRRSFKILTLKTVSNTDCLWKNLR